MARERLEPTRTAVVLTLLMMASAAAAQSLSPGFGEFTVSGLAGGNTRAVRHGNTPDGMCQGWIASSPNHTFELSATTQLTLRVSAPSDTTLVVLGPDGARCNDDAGNSHDPAISGSFRSGQYRVFVGSYEEGQSIRYNLTLSE